MNNMQVSASHYL